VSDNRTHRSGNGWKWAALGLSALLILTVTCTVSMLWGGMVGFVMGRLSAPQRYVEQRPFERFEIEPFPGLPHHPFEPIRPWLGVYYEMQETGALVTGILEGSPAQEAGLEVGDTITAVDRHSVGENYTLGDVIERYGPGDRVELTILRDGRELKVRVRLAARMEAPGRVAPDWNG
jgi:membrane-associated protease RseP (regulator of RpoE activity)